MKQPVLECAVCINFKKVYRRHVRHVFTPLRTAMLPLFVVGAAVASSASDWVTVKPGGSTLCGHGTEYAFFVSPGAENKLWFDLEGGGCCFDEATCSEPIWSTDVDVNATLAMLTQRGGLGAPTTDLRNPVANWTRVFVPYCTGDAQCVLRASAARAAALLSTRAARGPLGDN